VPNPAAPIINHDIADKIAIQDHGMKIRISDQSLNKMSESAKDSIAQLSIIINTASAEQIKAMSDVIGVPIVESLNANRSNVTNWFMDMYTQQLEPSRKQQLDITRILEDIRNNTQRPPPPAPPLGSPPAFRTPAPPPAPALVPIPPLTPALATFLSPARKPGRSPVGPTKQSQTIVSGQWRQMNDVSKMNLLKDAAARYIQSGQNIIQGADANQMDNSWQFIKGQTKKITVKDVKDRMTAGQHVLDLNNFTITRVRSPRQSP
jgi:hypothetical protein